MVLDDDLRQKLEEQLELLAERSRNQETTNEDLAKLTEQMICIVSLLEETPQTKRRIYHELHQQPE